MKHHGECARCVELAAEVADLQQTFDVQWDADMRAVKRWREAHPGNDLVLPDRANMVVWLLEQHDARAQSPLAIENEQLRKTIQLHAGDAMSLSRELDDWRERALVAEAALTSTERCRHCDEVVEPGHDCSAPSTERAKETP